MVVNEVRTLTRCRHKTINLRGIPSERCDMKLCSQESVVRMGGDSAALSRGTATGFQPDSSCLKSGDYFRRVFQSIGTPAHWRMRLSLEINGIRWTNAVATMIWSAGSL